MGISKSLFITIKLCSLYNNAQCTRPIPWKKIPNRLLYNYHGVPLRTLGCTVADFCDCISRKTLPNKGGVHFSQNGQQGIWSTTYRRPICCKDSIVIVTQHWSSQNRFIATDCFMCAKCTKSSGISKRGQFGKHHSGFRTKKKNRRTGKKQ